MKKKLRRIGAVIIILLLSLVSSFLFAQPDLSTDQWREDLRYMSEELPKRHINLFHSMTQDAFERAVVKLDERIPELQDHQIIVEFSRIAAMIGDGHSGIRLYDDPNIAFSSCPIRFYLYQDGLFVQRADRAFSEVVGARVKKIGNVSVDEAINLVRELISRDNEMYVKLFAPFLLTSPEILHALGINENINQATYVFEVEGEDLTVSMEPKGNLRLTGHAHYDSGMDGVDWVDARDASDKATPLWLKGDVRKSYWFEYLEEKRTVYFRFNEILNKKEESIFTFADRLSKFIADNDVDILVVDLRWNDGGDNQFTRPILRSIIQSRKIDKCGKLFVIIGRRTFSAAQTFVNELEIYTNALFVLEPTAERVNNYGDTYVIKLPHSNITVKASFIRFQQMDQRDTRQWTTPHLRTALTSEDYRNNSDPAMQAVFSYEHLSENLLKINKLQSPADFKLLVQAYYSFKANPTNAVLDTEDLFNRMGYSLLSDGRLVHAIEIFKRNVEAYPASANVYDSLGEAYMINEQKELAIKNYKKSLDLNPNNTNAIEMLKKLSGNK